MIHKHWELEPDELIPINGICGNRYENNYLCLLSPIIYIIYQNWLFHSKGLNSDLIQELGPWVLGPLLAVFIIYFTLLTLFSCYSPKEGISPYLGARLASTSAHGEGRVSTKCSRFPSQFYSHHLMGPAGNPHEMLSSGQSSARYLAGVP